MINDFYSAAYDVQTIPLKHLQLEVESIRVCDIIGIHACDERCLCLPDSLVVCSSDSSVGVIN